MWQHRQVWSGATAPCGLQHQTLYGQLLYPMFSTEALCFLPQASQDDTSDKAALKALLEMCLVLMLGCLATFVCALGLGYLVLGISYVLALR